LDELALLRGLTARLGDADALGIYNDWLEDHDDPRGGHLRSFLAAFGNGDRLPQRPRGVAAEWEELVGLGVRRRLRERADTVGKLEPYLSTLLDAGQACMRLELLPQEAMSRVPPAVSRAGGLPDLPAGTPWPMCEEARLGGRWPMLFLLQINLADLAGTLCEGLLPEVGLLTLFFYPENEPRGLDLRYTPPDVPVEWAHPPRPYHFHPIQINPQRLRPSGQFSTQHTRPIRLTEAMRYPSWVDCLPDEVSDFDTVVDGQLTWVLSGEHAPGWHYFASPFRRDVCPQWAPDLHFAEVPTSHLELFELSDEETLHWHFVDRLHVFVDGPAARTGVFEQIKWATI
jgi:hypothetical protein